MDLTKAAAYSEKPPYDLWQELEEIPIMRGHCVEDLTAIPVAPWKRAGVLGSFINLVGSGRTCGSYLCEMPPKGESKPQRCLYEQLIYVLKGRGATTVWNDDMRPGPVAVPARVRPRWILLQMSAHGVGSEMETNSSGSLAPLAAVAQLEVPHVGNKIRVPCAVFRDFFSLAVVETVFPAEPVDEGKRVAENKIEVAEAIDHRWRIGQCHETGRCIALRVELLVPAVLFVPPANWFHQHFNPDNRPVRYLALKPWGFTYKVEHLSKTDQDIRLGGTQIEYKDQDPEIHEIFRAECAQRGTEVKVIVD